MTTATVTKTPAIPDVFQPIDEIQDQLYGWILPKKSLAFQVPYHCHRGSLKEICDFLPSMHAMPTYSDGYRAGLVHVVENDGTIEFGSFEDIIDDNLTKLTNIANEREKRPFFQRYSPDY